MSDSQQLQNVDAADQSPAAQPGGLEAYLQQVQYQSPPPGLVVNEETGQVSRQEGQQGLTPQKPVQHQQQAAQPQVPVQQDQQASTPSVTAPQQTPDGVTTQPQGMTDAERRAYEDQLAQTQALLDRQAQVIQQQALDQLRREDAAFEAEVNRRVDAGEMTPAQAIQVTRQRETERLNRVQRFYAEQQRQREQEDTERRVQQAKNAVISRIMLIEGIPTGLRPVLSQAQTPEDLEATLQSIRPLLSQQQQAQVQQSNQQPIQQQGHQQNPYAGMNEAQRALAIQQEIASTGALSIGGDGDGTPPPEPPKQRSGDILGLLASREYQVGTVQ